MPQSKNRKAHKHHVDYVPHKKERKSAVTIAMIVCTILALGIAFFAAGPSVIGLVSGAVVGAVIGYFGGKEMDKAFDKN